MSTDQINTGKAMVKEQGGVGDSVEMLEIIDDVQRRIGQDLHDGVEQELVGLGMISQTLLNKLQDANGLVTVESLRYYRELAKMLVEGYIRAHEEVQAISRGLIPTNGFHDNLVEALESLAARTGMLEGVDCYFRCDDQIVTPKAEISLQLYRIAQEAVCNALKHSGAGRIVIALEQDDSMMTLRIADDGDGFCKGHSIDGLGLQSMQLRAHLIGAMLEITTVASGGTMVSCKFRSSGND